jgi:hypothetical protein
MNTQTLIDQAAHDHRIVQLAGEALWQVATSDDSSIARFDSNVYRATEKAFIAAVRVVYGLGAQRARRVRDLLAEYGPHDSLTGTDTRGVQSYVDYVMTTRP